MSSGLTRRRGGGGTTNDAESSNGVSRSQSSAGVRDTAPETSYENSENGHKIAFDPRDISESAERSKQPKLTLMDEIVLLGLKDKQVSKQASMRSLRKKRERETTTLRGQYIYIYIYIPSLFGALPRIRDTDGRDDRAIYPSGTIISAMPCAAALS